MFKHVTTKSMVFDSVESIDQVEGFIREVNLAVNLTQKVSAILCEDASQHELFMEANKEENEVRVVAHTDSGFALTLKVFNFEGSYLVNIIAQTLGDDVEQAVVEDAIIDAVFADFSADTTAITMDFVPK